MRFEEVIYNRLMEISSLTEYEREIIDQHFETFVKVYLLGCLDVK